VDPNIGSIKDRLFREKSQQAWNYQEIATHLESLASTFVRTSRAQHAEIIAQFHDSAGKLPYVDDCDFGALVLESAADATAELPLRFFLLSEARFRARWCVQAAGAGGEAIARAVHWTRLNAKVEKAGKSG
jgi:hypothetical protein